MTFIDIDTASESTPKMDKEQELKMAEEAVKGNVPTIPEPPDTSVTLPRGAYRNSKWITDFQVRELTGEDEERLAKYLRGENTGEFFNAVVVYGTARVGSEDLTGLPFDERDGILSSLLIGEREQLFLNIARVTFGDSVETEQQCPFCGSEFQTTVLISEDIEIPEIEDIATVNRSMTTSKGQEITYRLATGVDQKMLTASKGTSVSEKNTLLLSEVVVRVDGKPVVDKMHFVRSLSMGDRRRLLEAVISGQPSPNLNVALPCPSCDSEITMPFEWRHFFPF